ncbi:MAG: putative zinc-binding metallopeptidase [Aeromicrobium erythreum]
MRAFSCRVCGNALYFENSVCMSCGTHLAYSRPEHDIVPLGEDGTYTDADGATWHVCANAPLSGCTWLTTEPGALCDSCALTRTRPNDQDLEGLSQYPVAERAKRHLLVELDVLGLPVRRQEAEGDGGLAFDLLSSVDENVVIGHADGVITIDLAEGDDAHREKVRVELDEPYRTMLGHLRHEIGHYFESVLAVGADLDRVRALFGDDTKDYQAEIDRHYAEGPPADWQQDFISQYATMHPYEDFAETFAHVLHIRDTVGTAAAHGLVTVDPDAFTSFRDLVTGVWIPLSIGLNQINRSMGENDLYPFVLPERVLDKLELVADLVRAA